MQMSYLYASDFLSKPFSNSLNMQKTRVVDKSTDHDKAHFDFFFTIILACVAGGIVLAGAK